MKKPVLAAGAATVVAAPIAYLLWKYYPRRKRGQEAAID